MIASLSSKSEKRFLVNFQTKNEMMPITATPPATERPMMEPVPRPPELLEDDEDCVLDEVALLGVDVTSTVLVTSKPAELVVTCTEGATTTDGVVAVVAVFEVGVEVLCVVVGGGVFVVWGVVLVVLVVVGVVEVVVGVVVGAVVVGDVVVAGCVVCVVAWSVADVTTTGGDKVWRT